MEKKKKLPLGFNVPPSSMSLASVSEMPHRDPSEFSELFEQLFALGFATASVPAVQK